MPGSDELVALYDQAGAVVGTTTRARVRAGALWHAAGVVLVLLPLLFAALFVGAVLGLERRRTGHWGAPAITHVTWSLSMLFALPALFG